MRLPSSSGIESSNSFNEKLKPVSRKQLPSAEGMEPEIRLAARDTNRNRSQYWKSDEGIDPERPFIDKSNMRKLDKLPKASGMLPVMAFRLKFSFQRVPVQRVKDEKTLIDNKRAISLSLSQTNWMAVEFVKDAKNRKMLKKDLQNRAHITHQSVKAQEGRNLRTDSGKAQGTANV
jgi:hypothetical protein